MQSRDFECLEENDESLYLVSPIGTFQIVGHDHFTGGESTCSIGIKRLIGTKSLPAVDPVPAHYLIKKISPIRRGITKVIADTEQRITRAMVQRIPPTPILRFPVTDFVKDKTVYMVYDYTRGRDMSDLMIHHGGWIIENIRPIIKKIWRGMNLLWDADIVHMDIKPANIIISFPDENGVTLIDYGKSMDVSHDQKIGNGNVSTPAYATPYMLIGTMIDQIDGHVERAAFLKMNDMWAFGLLINEALTGRKQFASNTTHAGCYIDQLIDHMHTIVATPHILTDGWDIDADCLGIIQACLTYHPYDKNYVTVSRNLVAEIECLIDRI